MTAASGQETAGMPGATLHLGFDPLIQPVPIRKQTWTVVPEGTLANLHTSGITGQGLVSREAMDGILLQAAQTGAPTAAFLRGTFKCFFKPDWTSGQGPGRHATLAGFGQWKVPPDMTGYWGITMDPTGKQLQLGIQSTTRGETLIAADIQFEKDRWVEIAVSYAPEGTWIHVDGVTHGPGQGVSFLPPDRALSDTGLSIGNAPKGNQPVGGILDEVQWFNFPLKQVELESRQWSMSARVDDKQSSIHVSWPPTLDGPFAIRRRPQGQSRWRLLETEWKGFHYQDFAAALQKGQIYQYQVQSRSGKERLRDLAVGYALPANVHPGTILILVDETLAPQLQVELELYSRTLEREGWQVLVDQAPRHDDRDWSRNPPLISRVKGLVQSHLSHQIHQTRLLLLLGHVSVPYSGFRALDGHTRPQDDHRGAWPCDVYYGDLDGVWTDHSVSHTNQTSRFNSNLPGDGKFDQDLTPTLLEVGVGRIDFANMPSLLESRLVRSDKKQSNLEIKLLKEYLGKNILYRNKRLNFAMETIVDATLSPIMNQKIISTAATSAWATYGEDYGRLRSGRIFTKGNRSLWGFVSGYGGSQSLQAGEGLIETKDFKSSTMAAEVGFLALYSSWHADWNQTDGFMKACLSSKDGPLGVFSIMAGPWNLGRVGLGACLGEVLLASVNGSEKGASRAMAFLGDPSLRCHVTPPLDDVKILFSEGQRYLAWGGPQPDHPEKIHLYQKPPDSEGFEFFLSIDSEATSIGLPQEVASGTEFMVRQGEWIHSGSGSFANLSLGVVTRTP